MSGEQAKETAGARPAALITGASSGIGEAFARRLANEGYDLVLVARRKERLDALAAEVTARHGMRPEVFCADLTEPEPLARLEERIRWTYRLDLLVNNAGFMTPELFVDAEPDTWDAMARLHVLAPVRLTRAALPGMIERRRGSIINVASIASFLPIPHNVVYSASKNFLVTFTEGLLQEAHGTGVRVQALCPGWTHTELVERPGVDTSRIGKSWWMSADDVVNYSLRCLRRGKLICIPGWRNRLMIRAARLTPRPLLRWMIRKMKMNQVEMKP